MFKTNYRSSCLTKCHDITMEVMHCMCCTHIDELTCRWPCIIYINCSVIMCTVLRYWINFSNHPRFALCNIFSDNVNHTLLLYRISQCEIEAWIHTSCNLCPGNWPLNNVWSTCVVTFTADHMGKIIRIFYNPNYE